MKINNRGNILVELVVVSVIISIVMLSLYGGFASVYNQYKVRNSYFDINGYNALVMLSNFLINENKINNILLNVDISGKYKINCNDFDSVKKEDMFCQDIKNIYDIREFYIIKKESTVEDNRTIKEYVSFLNKKEGNYNYLLISESNSYKYSSLKLR